MDLKEEVAVDRYDLETGLEEQSDLVLKYGTDHADAVADAEHAGELVTVRADEVKEEDARLDADIRANWPSYDFPKAPTENAITAWITTHEKHKAAVNRLREAREEKIEAWRIANRLKSACVSFEHRKASLEFLTRLMLGGYYSKPNVPREMKTKLDSRAIDDQDRALRDGQKKELKGKTRSFRRKK